MENGVVSNVNLYNTNNISIGKYERALIKGDLAQLTEQECESYYMEVCKSVGLNPLTKPFEYICFQGKKILYVTKTGAEQVRQINGVSVVSIERHKDLELGILEVTAKVRDKHGREDISTSAIVIGNLKGNDLCNALMKAETKAKRRATLSLCGLGSFENEPDELREIENNNLNLESKAKEIVALADKKGSDLQKIVEFFGKKDISELSYDNLEYAKKVLEKKPDNIVETEIVA